MNYHEDMSTNCVQSEWKPLKPAMSEKEVRMYMMQSDNTAKAISDHVEDLVENERRKVSLIWTAIVLVLLVFFAGAIYTQHQYYKELKESVRKTNVNGHES